MWFSIGFAVSCAVGVYLISGSILAWLALFAGVVAIAALFVKDNIVKVIAVLLLGFSTGVLWMWGYDTVYLQPVRAYDGKMVFAQIEASDYSRATEYGATVDGKISVSNKKYNVRLYLDDYRDVRPGDLVSGVCTLGMTTPSGAEESDYYQGKGIFVVADADGAVLVDHTDEIPTRYVAALLRNKIGSFFEKTFPTDVLGFVRALFLGDTHLLTYEDDTALKVSGIRHIVAVSGLHVSILFAMIYTVAFRRRVSTALLGIPALLLFAAIAGFTPSISRACIMQILIILALLLNKEYDPPTALAFSALVLLAANPMTITSVSFQLSVGCVIGIFVFSGRISNYLLEKFGHPTGKTIASQQNEAAPAGVYRRFSKPFPPSCCPGPFVPTPHWQTLPAKAEPYLLRLAPACPKTVFCQTGSAHFPYQREYFGSLWDLPIIFASLYHRLSEISSVASEFLL